MYNFQNLEVMRVLPKKEGIFAFAKYPTWHYEYNFLIQPDGKVKGKTPSNLWLELSQELGEFIKAKIQAVLIEKQSLVYS